MRKGHSEEDFAKVHSDGVFAAANSGRGFKSFYSQILSDARILRRYMIKGGPGTGKSSFMRRVASAAESEGYSVDYYYCSSDHTSLDAIVIEGVVALVDSTPPHVMEPELVGAKDEIVNIGEFWDSSALFARSGEIESLSRKKSSEYAAAYRFLEAALAVDMRIASLSSTMIKRPKLEDAARRYVRKIDLGEEYGCKVGLRDSVGMKGRARLDYYEQTAEKIYAIKDHARSAHILLAQIADNAVANRNRIRISLDPINTECLDAVLFEESSTLFLAMSESEIEKYGHKIVGKINMKRFALRDGVRMQKAEMKDDVRLYEGLLDSAKERLAAAGDAHFELEKIYGECMDFEALESFSRSFAARVCDEVGKNVKP